MSFFSTQFNSCGLDFSDGYLKLAEITKTLKGTRIQAWGVKKIEAGIIEKGEIRDNAKLTQAIKDLQKNIHGHLTTNYVVSSLPESKVFIKIITLKNQSIKKTNHDDLKKQIETELPNHIPIDIEELRYDFQVIAKNPDTSDVLIAAIPKIICDQYLEAMLATNLRPIVQETEAQAVTRAIFPNSTITEKIKTNILNKKNKNLTDCPRRSLIIVNLGEVKSNLIFWDNNTIQFTADLDITGHKLTQKIAQKLNLSEDKAEKAKIICGLDPHKGKGEVYQIVDEFLIDLMSEIKKAQDYWLRLKDNPVETFSLNLVGDGASLPGLKNYLADKLKTNICLANPLANINVQPNIPPAHLSGLTCAIGLGLRHLMIEDF
ncbi:MAG TPA: pilus assembly protein PilM [bacterium]|nr:pilus assembly protein PilM [bacterium]